MATCVHSNFRAISAKDGPTNSNEGSVRKNLLNLSRFSRIDAPAIPAIWVIKTESDSVVMALCMHDTECVYSDRLCVCLCECECVCVCVCLCL